MPTKLKDIPMLCNDAGVFNRFVMDLEQPYIILRDYQSAPEYYTGIAIQYIDSGNMIVNWYINGMLHRDDGPAMVSKTHLRWYIHGKAHRVDGPAYLSTQESCYFLNGARYSFEGWISHPLVVEHKLKIILTHDS